MSDDEKDVDLGTIDSVQIAAGDIDLGNLDDVITIQDVSDQWVFPEGSVHAGDILVSDPNGNWTWQAPPPGIDFERDVIQVRAENIELRKRIERLERELEGLKRR